MARVLVTRAQPEAHETAKRLAALGHEAIVSPVLEISFLPGALDPTGIQALLFSSAAAAHALAHEEKLKTIPVLAVGDATARAAREAGFDDVRSAKGAGADLIALAQTTLSPSGPMVLHASGADTAVDIPEALRAHGFNAGRICVYQAEPARALTGTALDRLRAKPPRLDAVLFHSARGAESFVALLGARNLREAAASLSALCMSARVAEAAKALPWKEILVAPAPREDALLSLLAPMVGERS